MAKTAPTLCDVRNAHCRAMPPPMLKPPTATCRHVAGCAPTPQSTAASAAGCGSSRTGLTFSAGTPEATILLTTASI
eukprot:6524368-Prymnesium_polylepis.1